jgi:hypothetical protein
VVIVTPPPPSSPKPPPPRWTRDPWGLGLTGAGVAALGVGIGFLVASGIARSDAEAATTYPVYLGHWSTAGTRLDVAIAALAVGGVLVATGIGRFLLVRRHARDGDVALWVAPGAIGGSF